VTHDAKGLVERNIRAYSRAYRKYDRRHPEIFNEIEQRRLRNALVGALSAIEPHDRTQPRVLDLGCGSGNLTSHLVEEGAEVVAADVSPHFLKLVNSRFGVETLRLNGTDLRELDGGSVDMVGVYSVLHHIPDYLGMLDEIGRVLRRGGVAFLDHEVNENFWIEDGCVRAFRKALEEHELRKPGVWNPARHRWQRFLMPSKYAFRVRRMLNPAYPFDVEGDIHTWPHDHIDWNLITSRLTGAGMEVVFRSDYLHYSASYPLEVWRSFSGHCTDMTTLVARRPL